MYLPWGNVCLACFKVFFLLVSCKCSLYILGTTTITGFANSSSSYFEFCEFLFNVFVNVLQCIEILNFDKVWFLCFSLVGVF